MNLWLGVMVLVLVGCDMGEAPAAAARTGAAPGVGATATADHKAVMEAAGRANEVAVAQFNRAITACQSGDAQTLRDALSVVRGALRDWNAVPATDQFKEERGACADMLVDLDSLLFNCQLGSKRSEDLDKLKRQHYTEDAQQCNALFESGPTSLD